MLERWVFFVLEVNNQVYFFFKCETKPNLLTGNDIIIQLQNYHDHWLRSDCDTLHLIQNKTVNLVRYQKYNLIVGNSVANCTCDPSRSKSITSLMIITICEKAFVNDNTERWEWTIQITSLSYKSWQWYWNLGPVLYIVMFLGNLIKVQPLVHLSISPIVKVSKPPIER